MKEEDKIEVKLNQEEVQAIIDCYEKDLKYIKKLEKENKELHNKIDKAIDFIDIYTNGINLEAFDCLKLMYKIKDLLKDGDVDE